jgi:hypothetical protein
MNSIEIRIVYYIVMGERSEKKQEMEMEREKNKREIKRSNIKTRNTLKLNRIERKTI